MTEKRIGRPKKPAKRKVGRPKGEAGIVAEYRSRMLSSPKSRKVLDSILNAASTDGHPNQAAAWKLVMDRILPVSSFDPKKGGSKPSVTVNISGLETAQVATVDIDDADYEEMVDGG